MGEGTSGLSGESPGETARRLDAEITRLREELDGMVSELDRRRHEMLDVKLQVKRHPGAAALAGVALVAAAAGVVWLVVSRGRRRAHDVSPADLREAPGLVHYIRQAGARLLGRPAPAVEPTASRRFLAAVAPAGGRRDAEGSGPGRLVAAVATAAAARAIKSGVASAVRAALERWWSRPERAAPAAAGPVPAIARWGRGEPRPHLQVVPPARGETRP